MSRSKRKIPIFGITTCKSEKQDKRLANRKYRRLVRNYLHIGFLEFPNIRVISNVWCFGKDGKYYRSNLPEKYMRK